MQSESVWQESLPSSIMEFVILQSQYFSVSSFLYQWDSFC